MSFLRFLWSVASLPFLHWWTQIRLGHADLARVLQTDTACLSVFSGLYHRFSHKYFQIKVHTGSFQNCRQNYIYFLPTTVGCLSKHYWNWFKMSFFTGGSWFWEALLFIGKGGRTRMLCCSVCWCNPSEWWLLMDWLRPGSTFRSWCSGSKWGR